MAKENFEKSIKEQGTNLEILTLPQSTRTALEAANTIGCELGQIAKSIIFKTESSKAILVIASGANHINEKKIEALIEEKIGKADADFVKEKTGFTIGGVPPTGHIEKIITLIDEDLFRYQEIWAAAGNPNSVFKLLPEQLLKMTCGQVIKIK